MEPFESQTQMCRLCLREYKMNQMVDIFSVQQELDQAIYEAVSIRMDRYDATTSICNNCQNIIQIIKCFREACRMSDAILKNGPIALESAVWSSSNETNVIHQTAKLIKLHQQDIDILYGSQTNLEDQECALASKYILEFIKEDDQIENSDNNMNHKSKDLVSSSSAAVKDMNVDSSPELHDITGKEEMESDSEASNTDKHKRKRRKKSENRKDKVVCSTCGELVSQQGLEGHLNRHLGVQPFPCNVEGCDAKLYSKFALQQHRSRHKSSNRYFDCKVCGKRIKGSAYWLIHRKIHEEEPKFSCDICGKRFRRKCKLKVHSTVHSGIAEYPCEICGKFFTVKHNLTAHYKLHMKNGTYPDGFEPNLSVNV